MAQRLSEQVVEWLTVGGDSFTPHFKSNDTKTSVPLVVNKPGTATTFPTTGGTAIGIYNNQGQIWTLRDAASTAKALMSGQLIISSSDSGAGGISALELWRGTNASWQIANDGGVFYFRNNYGKTSTSASSETKQTSYTYDNVSFRYGALAEQYVRIHSTKDSDYEHTPTGAALIVDGGATFKKKVYIDIDTDSNYVAGADGALVTNGGASIGKKLYVGSTQASTSSTTGALVVNGGVGIAGDTNIATNKYLKVGQYITIGGNGDPADRSVLSSTTLYVGSSGNASLIFKTNGTARARFNPSGHFIPEANATYDIGSTTNRWKDFYLTGIIRVGAASTNYDTAAGNTVQIDNNEIIVNTGSNGNGIYIYGKGYQYGRFYVSTLGTAGTYTPAEGETPASSTNGTQGEAFLTIGNSVSVTPSSATSLGANNARGRVRLYGTGTTYTDLVPNPNGSRTVYLPYYAGTMYLVHGGSATATIGGGKNPVYVAANGRVTASSDTVGSATKPIYMSSGTLTASDSTVGSGSKPIYLSSGTLTASSSTVGSATKGTYLSAGTITAMTYELNATINSGTSTALAYYSGTNAISSEPRIRQHRSNRYPLDFTLHTDAAQVAEFWYDTGDTTNITAGSWRFREYSPNSTANTATTGYYENYFLPTVTTGRTANASYNILTTKAHAAPAHGTASRLAYYNAATTIASGSLVTDGSYLSRAGKSVSWYQGRNAALIKTTSYSGYDAILSIKTTNGDWSMGVYTSNKLYWTYVTDTNYNANTNSVTAQMSLDTSGNLTTGGIVQGSRGIFTSTTDAAESSAAAVALITGNPTGEHLEFDSNEILAKSSGTAQSRLWLNGASVLAGGVITTANHGTGNPSSSTAGNGTAGAIYFKRLS